MKPSWGGASFLPRELANVPNMNKEEEDGAGPWMFPGVRTALALALSGDDDEVFQRSSALTVKPPRGAVGNPIEDRIKGELASLMLSMMVLTQWALVVVVLSTSTAKEGAMNSVVVMFFLEAERKRENQRRIGFIDGFNCGSAPMGVGGSCCSSRRSNEQKEQ